jgi:SAM-dependent methyltransferase
MVSVTDLYRERFGDDAQFRNAMWRVLCRDYFQRLVPEDAALLEVGAGYCEFINHIRARRKVALDINPDTQRHAAEDVSVILSPSTDMADIADSSMDVVFMSNFLEHLTREDIQGTLQECFRCLRPGGRVIILQPNIRFLHRHYWMFPDHVTPVDDRALSELLHAIGFSTVRSISRFLPFTTKSRLPKSVLLLRIYLRVPLLQRVFGKQSLIIATK